MNNGVTNNTNNSQNQVSANAVGQPVTTNVSSVPTTSQVNNQGIGTYQTQTTAQTPQIIQVTPVQPQQPVLIPQTPNVNGNLVGAVVDEHNKSKKKNINIVPILLLIILVLCVYSVFSYISHKDTIENLMYNCTPITASKEEIKLDLNSTLVKDLYSKVATTIREDLAQPEFNDNLRLYLAYRQILENDKYDSNCNLFDKLAMEPYTCEVSTSFRPKAFKEETLTEAVKKLFGENTSIPFANIRLGSSCIGGYQYIAARGEFVQGICNQQTATSYRVTKNLKEAVSTRNTIILTEEVKYHENEGMSLPSYLKSGIYYYTFRLDMNYNYVLVSRTYESKY